MGESVIGIEDLKRWKDQAQREISTADYVNLSDRHDPEVTILLVEEVLVLRAENARLREALEEITYGQGPFSRDPLTHCGNAVEAMKNVAREALSPNVESTQRESSEEAQVNRDTTEVVLALHLLADQVGPLEDEGSLRGAAGVLEAHPVQWRAALADVEGSIRA